MKKVLVLIMAMVMLVGVIPANAANVVTMYSPNGDSVNVYDYEVGAYKNVGWYDYPVDTIYAPGNRSVVVAQWDVPAYTQSGWYTYPVTYVYNIKSGAVCLVADSDLAYYLYSDWVLPDYENAGISVWFSYVAWEYLKNSYGSVTDFTSMRFDYIVANNSGKVICARPEYTKVNGVNIYGSMSENIMPGTVKTISAYLDAHSIYTSGIRSVGRLTTSLNLFDWDFTFSDTTGEMVLEK